MLSGKYLVSLIHDCGITHLFLRGFTLGRFGALSSQALANRIQKGRSANGPMSSRPTSTSRRVIDRATSVYCDSVLSEFLLRRLDTAGALRTGAALEILLVRWKTSQEPTRSMGT
jgi:hypothetical protein